MRLGAAIGPVSAPGWVADLGERALRLLPLKVAGISGFIWIFFLGYFELLRHPPCPVFVMPLTGLDRWIPFQPASVLAYLSLWVYVGIAPGLLLRLRELLSYGCWAGALCLTGLACFWFWPTAVPRLVLPASDFPGVAILQGVDAAGNACPSMHVAIAIFSAAWIESLLRLTKSPMSLRLLNAVWFLAIAWSTLAVKQHVVFDVIAGAALGIAFAATSRWLLRPVGRRPGGADIIEATTTATRLAGHRWSGKSQ